MPVISVCLCVMSVHIHMCVPVYSECRTCLNLCTKSMCIYVVSEHMCASMCVHICTLCLCCKCAFVCVYLYVHMFMPAFRQRTCLCVHVYSVCVSAGMYVVSVYVCVSLILSFYNDQKSDWTVISTFLTHMENILCVGKSVRQLSTLFT